MVSLKNLWFVAAVFMATGMVLFMRPKESIFHSLNSNFLKEHLHSASNNSSMSEHLFRNDEIKKNSTRIEGSERKYSNLAKVEADLAQARAVIRAELDANQTDLVDPDYIPTGPMYWDPKTFHRSYREMEKRLKVYVYEEGEPPVFHFGPCKNTYAIEGIFMASMEVSLFRTFDPEEAHLFFLPISITMITQVIYVPESHDWSLMKSTASDYIHVIANKYPYWNRSLGADHFMLACHDWGPEISFAIPNLHKNAIRALCNANTSEKFNPSRDVSIPEIHLPTGTTRGLLGGPPSSRRPILVFYAGGVHGPIRPILLEHWENASDPDVQVHRYLPSNVSYYGMMRRSRYCICPSGYEVASPRMVEGLYSGCVPVLIKDKYVVPFGDVLDWEKFAVIVAVRDIPNLKRILAGISLRDYVKLQRQGIKMRRHFEVNTPPRRYDVFGMILHSIWVRRLNVRLRGDIIH
ncbi:hypothetical protein SASPL_138428 [Salvia splendens]|uniref:Exostosin GT47 domain-containing protein n=1 Tax=Salvia splendens TaxID=180675 RepID=A0A8X8WWX1_SALSN|nr:probable glycosyltransferase At5g03795 [Salvia splendens]KAG6401568.1 hypothetical protein SASPL_138428 [Salvia splendens]